MQLTSKYVKPVMNRISLTTQSIIAASGNSNAIYEGWIGWGCVTDPHKFNNLKKGEYKTFRVTGTGGTHFNPYPNCDAWKVVNDPVKLLKNGDKITICKTEDYKWSVSKK